MIAASFLIKHLLIDWREGEALVLGHAGRRRSRQQRRELAMGGGLGRRRRALFPHLQSRAAGRQVRSRGHLRAPLGAGTGEAPAQAHPPALGRASPTCWMRPASRSATTTRTRSSPSTRAVPARLPPSTRSSADAMPPPRPTTPQHYPISGWIEAGLYVFAIAFLSLTYVIGHRLGAHPIAFILYAMVVSAVALLAVTGPGPDARRIILAPQSWLVGAGIIGMEIFYYLLLEHLSPAEGSLLVRLAIPAVPGRGLGRCSRAARAAIAWAGVRRHLRRAAAAVSHDRSCASRGRRHRHARHGRRLQPARLRGRVPSLEPQRAHHLREAARDGAGGAGDVRREPRSGRRLHAAGRRWACCRRSRWCRRRRRCCTCPPSCSACWSAA